MAPIEKAADGFSFSPSRAPIGKGCRGPGMVSGHAWVQLRMSEWPSRHRDGLSPSRAPILKGYRGPRVVSAQAGLVLSAAADQALGQPEQISKRTTTKPGPTNHTAMFCKFQSTRNCVWPSLPGIGLLEKK